MSKDLWLEVWEQLKDELDREPTDEEMRDAYSARITSLIGYDREDSNENTLDN